MMSEFNPMWEIFKDNISQFVVVLTKLSTYYIPTTILVLLLVVQYIHGILLSPIFIHFTQKNLVAKSTIPLSTESFCNLKIFLHLLRLLDSSVTKSECGRCRDWISLYGIFPKTSLNVNLHRGGSACNVTYCIELRVGKSHQMFWCLAVTAEIYTHLNS